MYQKKITATWAQMDANAHLKNTAYSEFATHTRLSFFAENGFPPKNLAKLQVGPVILREEVFYYREVHLLENLKVDCALYKATKDFRKFHFLHHIYKENGKLAAKLTLDALWLDLKIRKPIAPPEELFKVCQLFPKTEDFEWLDG